MSDKTHSCFVNAVDLQNIIKKPYHLRTRHSFNSPLGLYSVPFVSLVYELYLIYYTTNIRLKNNNEYG